MTITHKKRVIAEDGTDPNSVHPSDWNDDHAIDGLLGLFAALRPAPNAFPVVAADGFGALAPISAPALSFLSRTTVAAMLEILGGVSPDSPSFVGMPTAPTAPLGSNTDQIATMAALQAMRSDLVGTAPTTLDTIQEIANALGADPNLSATITAALGLRLRVDAVQNLTAAQQAQAIANLALAVVASSGSYTDLKNLPKLGTAAALNIGTTAGSVVELDSNGRLPAVDGSQLVGVGGSVSYQAAQSLSDDQRLLAIANLGVPLECGVLKCTSATTMAFVPYKGDLVKINGLVYRIPAAGLTYSGLGTASTLHYFYLNVVNGQPTLTVGFGGHATSATVGNVGVEINPGADVASLVGMAYADAAGHWSPVLTASWFNRRTRSLKGALINAGSPGAYFQEVGGGSGLASPGARCYFLTWGDENSVQASIMANVSTTSVTNVGMQCGVGGNGSAPAQLGPSTVQYCTDSNNHCVSAVTAWEAGEGLNYATMMGGANAGTVTYLGQVTVSGIRG
ncbi:MAG: hypothetical protein WA418_12805 [Bradyrhizobium sp.]